MKKFLYISIGMWVCGSHFDVIGGGGKGPFCLGFYNKFLDFPTVSNQQHAAPSTSSAMEISALAHVLQPRGTKRTAELVEAENVAMQYCNDPASKRHKS